MKDKIKEILKNKLTLTALILSLLWLVLYFCLGAAIFKNMWNTSPALPVLGGIVAAAPLCAEILNAFKFKKRRLDILIICLCPVFILIQFFFFLFVLSKLTYFFIAGKPYFITVALGAVLAFFIFVFPRLKKHFKKISAICISAVAGIICLTCLFGATPFFVSAGAAVFAVNDEYQIAFATSHNSTAAVEVGGAVYFDQTAGQNNVSTLHKIRVPAKALDEAKSYTVITQGVSLNTAYLPTKGITLKKSYTFRPVDESDGLQIYNLSDTHECVSGPANAAKFFGDKLDLLILNGDIINDVSSEYQISIIYKLANRVTAGSVPVLFTRGNHECNGPLAADLGKYVGCADEGFYYTYKIGTTLSLLVLDTANDMADDNALISPIANFAPLRKSESEWIEKQGDWGEGFEYNFVIAHMAYPLSGYQAEKCAWHDWAKELVDLTCGKTQLAICGHSHKTDYAEVGTADNAVASYPVLRGSIRSNKYADKEGVSPFEFTGCAIELKDKKVNIKFTNANKKVLGEHVLEI